MGIKIDHERVLRSVIRAAWPDRGPTWPAFLEGGAVLCITDADANNWLPLALRSALADWRYCRRNPPPPQPQPPHRRRRRLPPRRRMRESGGGSWAPRPTPPPRYGVTEERAPPPAGERAGTASAGGNLLPRSPLTADRRPGRPPPAGQRRATTAGGTRGPSEGLHEGPALGRGGQGKSATPQLTAGPRGRDRKAAPPRPSGGGARGLEGPPHSPPLPLRPKSGWRQTEETATPHAPEEAAAPGVKGHRGRGKRPR